MMAALLVATEAALHFMERAAGSYESRWGIAGEHRPGCEGDWVGRKHKQKIW